MRFSIVWRLGLPLALLGVLATSLTGYYAYNASRDLLVKAAEERLLTATRVLMRQVTVTLKNTAADVKMIAEHPQAANILNRSTPKFQSIAENNVGMLFERMLAAHPEYFQMRMIDASAHGIERIRVDRDSHGVLRIGNADLQEKGHYPYVFETLRLPRGTVYISHASINHEVGAHAGLEKPALQVAAPVYGNNDKVLGLIVVNVDLNRLFSQLAADLPPELGLYLSNGKGDFLIHPNPARAFAFDRGQSALVQEEFPAAAALLNGSDQRKEFVVTSGSGRSASALVAAFMHQSLPNLAAEDDFVLGLAQPLASVVAESDRLATATMRIVLGFSALSILLAALLALTMVRPLRQIMEAVSRFAADRSGGTLPLARKDEIGVLARSIAHMQTQIRNQLESLHAQQDELDHLASHDSLTGLPNRRLFLDRLDRALARARRNHTTLALLFIDLDNFKDINDTHGHAAGDAVLCAVAQRLQGLLRGADTVARLGGDEFVILVEGARDADAIDQLVHKVNETLAEPIRHEDLELPTSGSIGISRYPEDGKDANALLAVADQAMYRAKAGKR
ncbi:MAG: diguanylate cyclase [Gammaproteobacteria bacterium]|nr:diguanylate cyclase [Gammaproteobacteria bacterium]MBU1777036.1 diguanylate cyclase [Gammaproteobacteria bacterium]